MTDSDTNRPPWAAPVQALLLVALLVLAAGAFLLAGMSEPEALPGLIVVPSPVRDHDNSAVLPAGERPPAGGVHHDTWLNCGVYREPVEAAQANHSLEHGAVWITYRPDVHPTQIAALENRFWTQSHTIVSPYPSQRSPIVLTAWGVQLEVESADDARIETFVDHYRLGPTAPESGGACRGGAGEPIN
ncbi:MAG: DUF3105 domain-containing protein [Anaerolineae bacterium]|nr:DUF3105 domain-containing protein [Anaerolineae bacterium]